MTACAARMPTPKYVLVEQEDMRSSTIASSTVMYNFGGGPRFVYVSASARHAK